MTEVFWLPLAQPPDDWMPLMGRLPADRRAQLAKMAHGESRRQSLCAELLVRVLACVRSGRDNRDLSLLRAPGGKPGWIQDDPFAFSLSHTEGAVALALSLRPVGADVERLRPPPARVAARAFSPAERQYLAAAPEEEVPLRFFTVWTRKEAFLKRDGAGLTGASLPAVDTQSAALSPLLWTERCDGTVISVCGDALPPSVTRLEEAWLRRAAQALTPFP